MRNQLPLLRLAKAFILVIVLICLAIACYPQPTPGTSAQDAFLYIVNVQAKDTGQNIVRAEVNIQVAGQIPLNTITDDKGIAGTLIGASFINQPELPIVEAAGYKSYRQV